MNFGFFGKILSIDLNKYKIEVNDVPEHTIHQYIGGYGLGCRLIYEELPQRLDPLDAEAILGFFPGLLTGTAAPLSGRYMVVGKSPLTGTWGDANSGGTFGPMIKKCGYDGILIRGRSQKPVYISIIDKKIEIEDAGIIWGMDVISAEKYLKNLYGEEVKTAGIGLAGEKLSRIAGIVNDYGRIAARSGLGALMGSKNLKMLVLKGNEEVSSFDKVLFSELVNNYYKSSKVRTLGNISHSLFRRVLSMVKSMRRFKIGMMGPPSIMRMLFRSFGTSMGNTINAENGDSPVKNWRGIGMHDFPFEKSQEISSVKLNQYKIRDFGCFGCPVKCGAILKVPELDLEETHLPEYETCCAFGTLLLNNDLLSIVKLNHLCNQAGLDTISTGASIGFAIECYEEGILDKNDTEGLELNWGNTKSIISLTEKIIAREGLGDILADGVRIASVRIGKGSEKYAIHSLGSELPMHDPKFMESLAFSYAFDPTPGRHTTASIDFTESGPLDKFENKIKLPKNWKKNLNKKVEAQVIDTAFHQVIHSAGMCMFALSFGTYPFLDLINALTGWNMSIEECLENGIKIQTIRQLFTLREGVELSNNTLPPRVIGDPPLKDGPLKGITVEYAEFYRKFCEKMGWDPKSGFPLRQTLYDLELNFALKDIKEI
jgi:aldehyde:ferredoxin oxidoreductase